MKRFWKNGNNILFDEIYLFFMVGIKLVVFIMEYVLHEVHFLVL